MGIKPSEIRPDIALRQILDKHIILQKSATESAEIKVYAQGERPNIGLDTEFVEILFNGTMRSKTKPIGIVSGNLAVAIYVKTYEDGSVFQFRVDSILKQLEQKVSNVSIDGFFFSINLNNIITPTTVNVTSGYSTTILNIEWHTV